VFAIAESPLERGVIWAGTNDGLVQLTRDGGQNWTNVTLVRRDLTAFNELLRTRQIGNIITTTPMTRA
jgi:hypothetical protein